MMSNANLNILIIEDEGIVALDLKNQLQMLGYTVSGVLDSGEDAMEKIHELHPDLVLIDIRLKGEVDGIQVAENLQTRFDIPVIFLTAYADEETLERAKVTEPYGYLVKPIDGRELHATVKMALYKASVERKFKEQEERYRVFLSNFQGIAYRGDMDFKPVFFHGDVEEITGYTEDEFLNGNPTWDQLIYPDDLPELQAGMEVIRSVPNYTTEREYRIQCKDGAIRWVRELIQNISDDDGCPVQVQGAIYDITDRRIAQEALQQSFQELAALNTLSHKLSVNLSVDQVIRAALNELVVLLEPDLAFCYLRAGNELNLRGSIVVDPNANHDATPVYRVGQFLCELAVRQEQAIYSLDIHADPRCTWQECKQVSLRSFAALPLIVEDRTVGVLGLSKREEHDFSKQASFLETATGQIAIAMQNALLFEQAQAEIAERRRVERALSASEETYRTLVENLNVGVYRTTINPNGRFLHVNSAFVKMFGYDSVEELLQVPVEDLYQDPKDRLLFLEEILGRGFVKDIELFLKRRDGKAFWASCTATVKYSDSGEAEWLDGVLEDITDRKRFEQQLLHDAFHDKLTGLPNRALFMDRLERAIQRADRRKDYRFAVLYLDLDRFKIINDSLGHLIGDKLLVEVAHKLSDCSREVDTVSRLSGDEFTILMEDIRDIHSATRLAERIKVNLAIPFVIQGIEMVISTSIGIVISSGDYIEPGEYLRDADIAMYRAKQLGKARYEIFDSSMREEVEKRLKLEGDLRNAVTRKEFLIHYQPIMSLTDGRIVGFEALLRWMHPELGLLFPSSFIRVAEETGIIGAIDKQVLQEACLKIRTWNERFRVEPLLTLSVNISGVQLSQPDLVDQIAQALEETGLPGECLILEITENAVIENPKITAFILAKIKKLRVNIHLDDFGTGYSSLNALRQIPVDTIKVDRSFVSEIDKNSNLGLIRTIISMGHELGLEIIAEGIETREQLIELRALGSEYGQGYLFARPQDEEATEKLLTDGIKGATENEWS